MTTQQITKIIILLGLTVILAIGVKWQEIGAMALIEIPATILLGILICIPMFYWISK